MLHVFVRFHLPAQIVYPLPQKVRNKVKGGKSHCQTSRSSFQFSHVCGQRESKLPQYRHKYSYPINSPNRAVGDGLANWK